MALTCADTLRTILDHRPALPPGKRLETALKVSGLDAVATLVAMAYRESRFDPGAASPTSSAVGLLQFLKDTANDTQDRVVKQHLAAGASIPNVPAGKRFVDYRADAAAAAYCAWAYLLDRIAANGNQLEEGISAFGTGDDYGGVILKGVKAIQTIAQLPVGQPTDLLILTKTLTEKCPAVKAALDVAFDD